MDRVKKMKRMTLLLLAAVLTGCGEMIAPTLGGGNTPTVPPVVIPNEPTPTPPPTTPATPPPTNPPTTPPTNTPSDQSLNSIVGVIVVPDTWTLTEGSDKVAIAKAIWKDSSITELKNEITWSSADEKIATVSASGQIKALKAGSVGIRATLKAIPQISGLLRLTVTAPQPTVSSVSVAAPSLQMEVGASQHLTAEVRGTNQPTTQVTWTTTDPNIISVDGSGEVVANAEGTARITATSVLDPTKSATVSISARNVLKISPANLVIGKYMPGQLTANMKIAPRSWQSSDRTAVNIDQNGSFLTDYKSGQFTVSVAGTDGQKASTTVIIRDHFLNRERAWSSINDYCVLYLDYVPNSDVTVRVSMKEYDGACPASVPMVVMTDNGSGNKVKSAEGRMTLTTPFEFTLKPTRGGKAYLYGEAYGKMDMSKPAGLFWWGGTEF